MANAFHWVRGTCRIIRRVPAHTASKLAARLSSPKSSYTWKSVTHRGSRFRSDNDRTIQPARFDYSIVESDI
jgi:hypothetical protein